MTAQSGLGFSGIVAIQIPDDGAAGEVLTKVTADNYDYDWAAGGGGGAPANAEYVVLSLDATLTDERVLTAGTGIALVDGGAGGLVTLNVDLTLQEAYDNAPAPPQITVNAAQPLTIDLAAALNDVFALRDELGNDLVRIDDVRDVHSDIGLTVDGALAAGQATSILLSDTYTQTAVFIGGGILSNGTVTFTNATWIWALMQESKSYLQGVAPGFAAFTLFNALATIGNSGNFNLVQAIVLNNGVSHRRVTAGTSTTVQSITVNASPNTRTLIAGAVMTKTTGDVGLQFAPTHGTVALSTVNHGTLRGLRCLNPAPGFFQPSAGVEAMTAYIGVEVEAIPFGGNVTKRALRSALTAATLSLMIENTGGAASDFGTGILHFDDLTPVQFGGAAVNAQDVSLFWNSVTSTFDMFFIANSDNIEFSNPVNGQILINVGADEFTFNTARGVSFGAGTGTLGNQIFNFAAGAFTVTLAGGFSQVLLTQAGSLNIGALGMSEVVAWTINALSFAGGDTGTIADLNTLRVGGMVTSDGGNTVTERAAIHSQGRFQQLGFVQYTPISPATLGAANNNDYNGFLTATASNSTRRWGRITGDGGGASVITGIDASAVQDGDTLEITNIGAATFTLTNQDAASVAANRIILGSWSGTLVADDTVTLRYDSTTARWRTMGSQVA